MTRGTRLLPMRHTELATGAARSDRRHFFEIFAWMPLARPRTWTLRWAVFEVVRDDLVQVTWQEIRTADGADQTTASAGVRVNDRGDAEWAVLSGPAAKTGAIASDADRAAKRAAAQEARNRQAAAAGVDYARTYDLRRTPTLAYADGNSNGCGLMVVYGWTADRAEAITVRADTPMPPGAVNASFDLSMPRGDLEVAVHMFDRAQSSWPYCTDVRVVPPPAEDTWRAIRGTLSIEMDSTVSGNRTPGPRASVRILCAQFVSPSGAVITQTRPIVLTAIVGWFSS